MNTHRNDESPSVMDKMARSFLAALVMVSVLAGVVLVASQPASATTPTWFEASSSTSGLAARNSATMAYDPATNQTILFGGNNGSTYYNDTWVWSGTSWTEVATTGPVGAGREGVDMAYDSNTGQFLLFGGDNNGTYYNDTYDWVWNATTNTGTWNPLTTTGTLPTARYAGSMAYDSATSQMLLFGGQGSSGYLGDTWSWTWNSGLNQGTWNSLTTTPSSTTMARFLPQMAYDTSSSQLVLFGGYGSSGYLDDTYVWSWNGTTGTWNNAAPSNPPTGRMAGTIAYDSATSELVLFGGSASAGLQDDTWGWTSTTGSTTGTWTNLTPTLSPSPGRNDAAMAYDTTTSQMVLYGGYNGGNLGDTWLMGVPIVTAVSPVSGSTAGSTSVLITGAGFNGSMTVSFGSTAATGVTVTSSTSITATAPAGSANTTVNVTVTNSLGTSPTSGVDQYAYEDAPTVTAISPSSGTTVGGTSVTITGTNFTDATGVTFGTGNSASSYSVISSTSMTATSPSGTGTVDIQVTTPVGTSLANVSDDGFTYETVSATVTAVPGYRLAESDGAVVSFGADVTYGSMSAVHLAGPAVGLAATPDGNGYWLVASDGGVFAFGDAVFSGSLGHTHLNQPIVGMAPTSDGNGYWLVASDGGVFAFGDAVFSGSLGHTHLNRPIVGMTPTPDGNGYWLVASDGGVFAFGDAVFHGSLGHAHLKQPIVGLSSTPDGDGYWLVGSDGGVFAYGDATYYGSLSRAHLDTPIVGITATSDGKGYWLVASDGGIFSFGDAAFYGSDGNSLGTSVVGFAA